MLKLVQSGFLHQPYNVILKVDNHLIEVVKLQGNAQLIQNSVSE